MSEILTQTELAELICTRISHDVIGNVGAVSNAVELLEEGDMDFIDDIRSILKVSSTVLSARLKFFRMAFGLNNSNLEDFATIQTTTENYLKTLGSQNHPISLALELHTPRFSRLAMLAIMILADTLIKGGQIEAREVGDKLAVIINTSASLSTEKIKNIKLVLAGNKPENNIAQYAPVFYMQTLLANQNRHVTLIEDPTLGLIME